MMHGIKSPRGNRVENNAILKRLSERGRIKTVSGGRTIVQELEYAENGNAQWYSGYETLNIAPQDVITAAEFDWKQAACAVSISGLEGEVQNTGENAIIDLLEARIGNAEKTMANFISAGMYSLGTGSGGKEIGGLQLLVADTPTNQVGGISRTTWDFWKNQVWDASSASGTAASTTNIQSNMNALWLKCCRGTDKPDIILADDNFFRLYWQSLQSIQRITSADKGMAGFQTLQYMGADVVFDGGQGGNCPANHMYFLNTNYLFYRPHRDRNMVPLNPDRHSVNQDAIVKLIGWAGNMTVSNSKLQGVLKA